MKPHDHVVATLSDPYSAAGNFQPLLDWFAQRNWTAAPFQVEVWQRFLRGESGLLHAPTGSGKTLAAFGGALLQALQSPRALREKTDFSTQLRVLWITPLGARAAGTVKSLRAPIEALGIPWTVEMRTGQASSRHRRLSKDGRAEVVVIAPESLALMLSYPESSEEFSALDAVIVDEWHELIGNKRGVFLQLCLARLRTLAPTHTCWGLSATLGNLEEARDVLLPTQRDSAIVSGVTPRGFTLETLMPSEPTLFPWAGHLALPQLKSVLDRLLKANTSIVFTNTPSQAELWHRALAAVWPHAADTLALHHGSLCAESPAQVEQGIREGTVRCVVTTSSVDLGVDFPAVDIVFHIGSPRDVSRLLQRCGCARHRPGEARRIVCVPTHELELAEFAAARELVARGDLEARHPPTLCLDVLAQHCVTSALGGGFVSENLLAEVRTTHAFANLSDAMWQQTLDFIAHDGAARSNNPEHRKVVRGDDGIYRVSDRDIATRHRLNIGTYTSDSAIDVRFLKGKRLGSIDEAFLCRLRPGDKFHFAGRLLTLVRLENMSAYVRIAKGDAGSVPRWQGERMPLSRELAAEVERLLALSRQVGPEMCHLRALSMTQERKSAMPAKRELLVEWTQYDDKWILTIYPFAGCAINESIAALVTMRWSRFITTTFAYAANDYGFIIALPRQTLMDQVLLRELLSPNNLVEDLRACVNVDELSRRQFRETARIAGLLPPSLPGRQPRSAGHLQASAASIYDMLQRLDPDHPLLAQAQREVFEAQLDVREMSAVLTRCVKREIRLVYPLYLSPLAFSLWAERWRGEWSNKDWKMRMARASGDLEVFGV